MSTTKVWSLLCLLAAALALVHSKDLPKPAISAQAAASQDAPNKRAIDPKAYVTLGGRQYYFSVISVSYREAVLSCEDANMELVSIESLAEYNLLVNYIEPNFGSGPWWWSSGLRVGYDWFWTASSTYFSYSKWYSGSPSIYDSTTQSCMFFDTWGWLDVNCYSYNAQFVCERNHPTC